MSNYDINWLVDLQAQRRAEAVAAFTPAPYYFIVDHEHVDSPRGYDEVFDDDPDSTDTGDGIVVKDLEYRFFPDTQAGRTLFFKVIREYGYETDGPDSSERDDRDLVYPTTKDDVATIAEFYNFDYIDVSRSLQPNPATDLMFLSRHEAQEYLAGQFREGLRKPRYSCVVEEAAYETRSVAQILHLIDNIDLERSTIVLKEGAPEPVYEFTLNPNYIHE